jgi:tetraacyldisaccharide 4'-kinase
MILKKFIFLFLYPFSILYDGITQVRNFLYNHKYKKVQKFHNPVINIGNLTVGGTGKTPHVEYLIHLLKNNLAITTLSRGYKRTTKGFLWASQQENALTLGDEPMQFYTKFGKQIRVAVGEKRAPAIETIFATKHFQNTDNQLVILDDAFQHRPVEASINILLSDYNRPFYEDYVLPSGRLRENRQGAKRAHAIIVSKCPVELAKKAQQEIQNKIIPYTKKDTPIFFSYISYQKPKSCFEKPSFSKQIPPNVILFTGIAKTAPLVKYVKTNFNLIKHFEFGDHHQYTISDIEKLKMEFEQTTTQECCLLCTEKDSVKLQQSDFKEILQNIPVFYLPICIDFFENELNFDDWLMNELERIN